MTPNDLIKLALKQAGVLGIGQTPMAEDVNDAFTLLNMMLGQWNRKRWLVFHLVDVSLVATGAVTYSVGPGGDFNVARVDGIEAAFLRLLNAPTANQVDVPLQVMRSYEDYAAIPQKGQNGYPQIVFLDTSSPRATLYPWPVPDGQYEIHLILKATLAAFTNKASDIALPAEYQEAILYNLAARLRSHYALGPDPTVTALARASLNTIRVANTQVPSLRMPDTLVGRGAYNVITDR